MNKHPLLHELPDFSQLIRIISEKEGIAPQLVEKDYWLMHCLWSLQNQGFIFELKGGTSLSKGWNIIERFSEDVDIKIMPPKGMDVPTGKNQTKPAHREKRNEFFAWLSSAIQISGISLIKRDAYFEDQHIRNCGLRLLYDSSFDLLGALKQGVLLEVGFDVTTPNEALDISSWAYNFAAQQSVEVLDNRAKSVPCYFPEYTLIEKLSAISKKYRQERKGKEIVNFTRHYYDVYQLLAVPRVREFIGTPLYLKHKLDRFSKDDDQDISKNPAFSLTNLEIRKLYAERYANLAAFYYRGQPSFESILDRIQDFASKL